MSVLVWVTAALWLAGWWLLLRVLRCRARPAATPLTAAELSIVIPARDEERNLPRLLRSIREHGGAEAQVIVVDDGSRDRTADVARAAGATVIAAGPLPDRWRGKPWACSQGAARASGSVLLFLDADAWFAAPGLSHLLKIERPAAFSLVPFHETSRPYESLSLFFNLVMTLGTLPRGLFGQMLLIDVDAYRAVGGHQGVSGRILEHWALAEILRSQGLTIGSAPPDDSLRMRMYPGGPTELIEGWSKAFSAGAAGTPVVRMLTIIAWLSGLMTAFLLACFTSWGWILYLGFALQLALLARKIGKFPCWVPLVYPIALLFFFVVFARSSGRSGKVVTWKGREIHGD